MRKRNLKLKNWKRFHEIFRILEAYVLRRARLESASKFEKELSILKKRKLFNFRKKNLVPRDTTGVPGGRTSGGPAPRSMPISNSGYLGFI